MSISTGYEPKRGNDPARQDHRGNIPVEKIEDPSTTPFSGRSIQDEAELPQNPLITIMEPPVSELGNAIPNTSREEPNDPEKKKAELLYRVGFVDAQSESVASPKAPARPRSSSLSKKQ